MKKMGFPKLKMKKTSISKAFEAPKGGMAKPTAAPPFGRIKRNRGTLGPL